MTERLYVMVRIGEGETMTIVGPLTPFAPTHCGMSMPLVETRNVKEWGDIESRVAFLVPFITTGERVYRCACGYEHYVMFAENREGAGLAELHGRMFGVE